MYFRRQCGGNRSSVSKSYHPSNPCVTKVTGISKVISGVIKVTGVIERVRRSQGR